MQQYSIIYLLVLPSLDISSYMRISFREMSEKKIFWIGRFQLVKKNVNIQNSRTEYNSLLKQDKIFSSKIPLFFFFSKIFRLQMKLANSELDTNVSIREQGREKKEFF